MIRLGVGQVTRRIYIELGEIVYYVYDYKMIRWVNGRLPSGIIPLRKVQFTIRRQDDKIR